MKSKGYTFESDTDTEVIAKLALFFFKKNSKISFRELVELVCLQLVSIRVSFMEYFQV